MNVWVWVEAKSCLAFHVGSEMFLQSISKIKCVCLLILQSLLSQCSDVDFDIHWAFLVGNPIFVLCLGESASFLPQEWMEHCVCGAGMSNPHLWDFWHYNSLFCAVNNVSLPQLSQYPGQCRSPCSPSATAAMCLLPLHSPAFSMGKGSCSSFRKLGRQLIRILAAWMKLVI